LRPLPYSPTYGSKYTKLASSTTTPLRDVQLHATFESASTFAQCNMGDQIMAKANQKFDSSFQCESWQSMQKVLYSVYLLEYLSDIYHCPLSHWSCCSMN